MQVFYIYIDFLKIHIDINSTISLSHGIGDALLFLNYFVSSLYVEYLTSEIHLQVKAEV